MKLKKLPIALKVSLASASLAAVGLAVTSFTEFNSTANKVTRWSMAGLCVLSVVSVVAFAIPSYAGEQKQA